MTSDAGPVEVVTDGALATLTLGRPALDRPLKVALRDALERVAADETVRAVLLTGSGRTFCVGQDLGEHARMLDADAGSAFDTLGEHYGPVVTALTGMPKPVVVAVNGACVGAGLAIALAGDVRIAADTARFGTAFAGIGLTFDSGLAASLARTVGAGRALELTLLGDPLDAAQALAWGVVGRVVPAEGLAVAAREVAARLAAGPTAAYAAAKRLVREAWAAGLPDVLAAEHREQTALGLTSDHQRAVASFLAKQPPTFSGR